MLEFAHFYWYDMVEHKNPDFVVEAHGALYNYSTKEALKTYDPKPTQEWCLPYVLAVLSAENWEIVYMEKKSNRSPKAADITLWLQREVRW